MCTTGSPLRIFISNRTGVVTLRISLLKRFFSEIKNSYLCPTIKKTYFFTTAYSASVHKFGNLSIGKSRRTYKFIFLMIIIKISVDHMQCIENFEYLVTHKKLSKIFFGICESPRALKPFNQFVLLF